MLRYVGLFSSTVVGGSAVTVGAGILVRTGVLNFFVSLLVTVAADITGDVVWYLLGRYGGRNFIERCRWVRHLGITEERVSQLEGSFAGRRGIITVVVTNFIQGVTPPVMFTAGVAKMSFRNLVLCDSASSFAESSLFLVIGYYAGEAYLKIDQRFHFLMVVVTLTFLLTCVVYRKRDIIVARLSRRRCTRP